MSATKTRPGSWVLAIDFGTSSTAAAIGRDGGAELVGVDGGLPRMLSNVFWQESTGRLLLGDVADNASALAPWCFERSPKVKLGQQYMLLGDERVRVADVVGAVIGRVSEDAVRLRGGDQPATVRLTHPVRWGNEKREALVEAAAVAGLTDPELVLEPVAAAMHYASERLEPGQHVAVYDLGGGTLDTAVLQRTEGGFEVVGEPRGRDGFGGEEFDHRLYRFLGAQLPAEDWLRLRSEPEPDGDNAWPKANRQFQRNVRRAKELLTNNAQVDVDVPSPVNRGLTLTVEDLNGLIRLDLEDSVSELERTIHSAGLEPQELAAVYLAGGSSQIPIVGQLIQERLGIKPQHLNDSKAVICLGAAIGLRSAWYQSGTGSAVGNGNGAVATGPTAVQGGATELASAAEATAATAGATELASAGATELAPAEPTAGWTELAPAAEPPAEAAELAPAGEPTAEATKLAGDTAATAGAAELAPAGEPTAEAAELAPAGEPTAEAAELAPAGEPTAKASGVAPAGEPTAEATKLAGDTAATAGATAAAAGASAAAAAAEMADATQAEAAVKGPATLDATVVPPAAADATVASGPATKPRETKRRTAKPATAGPPADTPPAAKPATAKGTSGPDRRILIGVGIAAIVIIAIVVVLVSGGGKKKPTITATGAGGHTATSGPITLSFPSTWKPTTSSSAPGAIAMGGTLAGSHAAATAPIELISGKTTLVAGVLKQSGKIPGSAPPKLVSLYGPPSGKTHGTVAGAKASEYIWPTGAGREYVAVAVIPTVGGDIALVCGMPSGSSVSTSSCEHLGDGARITGIALLAPGSDTSLGTAIDHQVNPIVSKRNALKSLSGSGLRGRAGRIGAAGRADSKAAHGLTGLNAPARFPVATLASALNAESRALASLASAADAVKRSAYTHDLSGVTAASKRVAAAAKTLGAYGLHVPTLGVLNIAGPPAVASHSSGSSSPTTSSPSTPTTSSPSTPTTSSPSTPTTANPTPSPTPTTPTTPTHHTGGGGSGGCTGTCTTPGV